MYVDCGDDAVAQSGRVTYFWIGEIFIPTWVDPGTGSRTNEQGRDSVQGDRPAPQSDRGAGPFPAVAREARIGAGRDPGPHLRAARGRLFGAAREGGRGAPRPRERPREAAGGAPGSTGLGRGPGRGPEGRAPGGAGPASGRRVRRQAVGIAAEATHRSDRGGRAAPRCSGVGGPTSGRDAGAVTPTRD